MIRKYALIIAGAVLLTGLVALALNNKAVAQETPPEAVLAPSIDVSSFFSYQGYLTQGGVAVNGSCDFEFRLYNALTAGTQVGPTQPANGQAISAGRFTVLLNFGPNAVDGQARWLQIGELEDTVALADVIERLRRELPRCAAAALAEGCGDRRCEDARGEDCSTCPSDCACGPGRECVTLPDRPARCNFSAVGLKD